jgi:hypothetical protein
MADIVGSFRIGVSVRERMVAHVRLSWVETGGAVVSGAVSGRAVP